jgi:hypothetical protein
VGHSRGFLQRLEGLCECPTFGKSLIRQHCDGTATPANSRVEKAAISRE